MWIFFLNHIDIILFFTKTCRKPTTVSLIAKNVEKARDKLNTEHGNHEPVAMTDKEAKGSNISVRENSNDTAVQLTTTVQANSTAILRGFKVVNQEVVGAQEVAVTIRWDKDSEKTARLLESKFGSSR